jgi:RNA polymerase sigma factor (TIGR02999 family)
MGTWNVGSRKFLACMADLRMNAMDDHDRDNVTALINEARAGGKIARDRLFRAIYEEFHRIAKVLMGAERCGHSLQPSDVVNEAVLRLLNGHAVEQAPNRRFLFGAAARVMRQVLVDHYRKRTAMMREGKWKRVPLDEVLAHVEEQDLDFIGLNLALDRLTETNERQGLVVVLRFFAGLSVAQVAQALDVSVGTVEADWRFARAWLRDQLEGVDR